MNADRRKRLEAAVKTIEEAALAIQTIADEEQEAYENIPESLQQTEKAVGIEDGAQRLAETKDTIYAALEDVGDLVAG